MSDENVDLIRQRYRRFEQGDFAAAEFFDPDVEHARIGGDAVGTPGVWSGIDDMWKATVEWLQAWEDVRIEPSRFVDVGDRVLVIARETGRGRRSGIPLDHESAQLFTVRSGKIVRWEGYWEVAEALKAAGLES